MSQELTLDEYKSLRRETIKDFEFKYFDNIYDLLEHMTEYCDNNILDILRHNNSFQDLYSLIMGETKILENMMDYKLREYEESQENNYDNYEELYDD
jgi:hypothetical protein